MKIFPMTLIRSGGLPLGIWTLLPCGIPDWAALLKFEQTATAQLLQAFDEAISNVPDSALRTAVYNARKDFFQRRKLPSVNFESNLRSEKNLAQLFDSLAFWHKIQQEKKAAENLFEQNLAANYNALQTISHHETLQRALLFASHDLLAALPVFAEKSVEKFDKKDRRTAFSLLQYLTRAIFKTSPLGRFTTVQVHRLNATQAPSEGVGDWFEAKPLVTPNVALLPSIYEVLLREPAFFQSLNVLLNPCIIQSSAIMKGASWLYFDGVQEAFQRIDPDPVADLVVKALFEHQRIMPFQTLIKFLGNEVDASPEALTALLIRLIDIGLLEWQLPERGLSPSWCGGLYNYLGYLPSSAVLTEAAYLLQWLRTGARTMSFQTIIEAQNLQRETHIAVKSFLEKHAGEMPPISPEQIFFEDVAQDHPVNLPAGVIEKLVGQLADCWQQKDFHAQPPFRTRIQRFAADFLAAGKTIDFLDFSKRFLEAGGATTKDEAATSGTEMPPPLQPAVYPRHKGKVGALLQIFKENGEYKAVVNAMFPGGGKLFARWLPLFSADVSAQIKNWQTEDAVETLAFSWQGWSNANFQPILSKISLAVPDARVGHLPGGREILLADLTVRKDAFGFPQLIDKQSNKQILFTDLGLEAPETRPPVMQVLWHLGVPFVSSESLLPERFGTELVAGIRHRHRLAFESLVLVRAAWELPPEAWGTLFVEGKSQAERIGLGVATLKYWGIPRQFFGRFTMRREKPQFYDLDSPISMLLLEKNLRGGSGNLHLTEMLPRPEHWLGDRVGEFVVEFLA